VLVTPDPYLNVGQVYERFPQVDDEEVLRCLQEAQGVRGLKPSPPEGRGTRMARSCLEGPVFDGTAIAWAELGHPDLEGAVR
jgi:hypothetical protein